jgi:hypothetical protein
MEGGRDRGAEAEGVRGVQMTAQLKESNWRAHVARLDDHGPMPIEQAEAQLFGDGPAWLLRLDGQINHANLLAVWLWGALDPQGIPQPEALVGRNVFEVFANNATRLPPNRNHDFWLAKFRAELLILQGESSPLEAVRDRHPDLNALYEKAAEHPPGNVWRYFLEISPRNEEASVDFLRFETTITAVATARQPSGYFAFYKAGDRRTSDIINDVRLMLYEKLGLAQAWYLNQKGGVSEFDMKEGEVRRTKELVPQNEQHWRDRLGAFLDRPSIQKQLGVSDEEFDRLNAKGRVLGLPTAEGIRYPEFQFNKQGGIDPTVAAVVGIFDRVVATPYTTASWLHGRKFDGKTVHEWLDAGGDPETVIRAAENAAADLDH